MKKLNPPIDGISLIRFLHLHCFIHIYKIFYSQDASQCFSSPRFDLFKPIKNLYKKKQTQHSLFKNILFSYQNQIIFGSIVTLIFASCNLLVPQLIKSFLHFMHQQHVNKSQVATAQHFIQKFFIIQFLRILFGQHAKRLFYQLAIQIQSSLCKKLIRKSLSFQKQCRDRMPKSQIIQLENVDLKLIFNMFKNGYMVIQAPFTIVIAIILLFRQNHTYGIIGIYWFIIAFLLQRELDGKMRNCNQTKLKLIDERSKINYELFGKIQRAKIIHAQQIIIQKNNDLFIQQNHDHYLFYFYSTLYDISLLILPIIVVVTISLFDMDNVNHITVQQVYVMLQLLGICYNPMKMFRTITISFHDGLHSLNRLQTFFNLPDQLESTLINTNINQGDIMIKQNTICTYPNVSCDFQLHITKHIQLEKGSRLIILGKKGQGKTSFIKMLLGHMKKIDGVIFINGRKASCLQNQFFRKASILQNIVFCDQTQQNKQQYKQKVKLAQTLFKELQLQTDFITKNGINTIVDQKTLSKKQMKKIELARVFVANPNFYILQSPFALLDKNAALTVQRRLRQRQIKKNTVIMCENNIQYAEPQDKVLIFEKGISIQFGTFGELINNPNSKISFFFKARGDKQSIKQPDSARKIIGKFRNRVTTALSFVTQLNSDQSNDQDNKSIKNTKGQAPNYPYARYRSLSLINHQKKKKKLILQNSLKYQSKFWSYFAYYLKSISWMEFAFVLVIIAVAEFLHIFIHYYIGHLDEDQQDNPYLEFQNILIIEFILTIALAAIIYFQGEVSSLISVIQGNNLYSLSLKSILKKPINWFNQQFSVKLADKFNHDYQQIFIACHSVLSIYKNIVILIITIYVVSSDKSSIFLTIIIISSIYLSIAYILRKVEHKVVRHFYDYKYQFVKIFEECLEGGITIQIYNTEQDMFLKTQKVYTQLAAYKLAQSYTSYGEEIFCDFTSLVILLLAFSYGLQKKIDGNNYNVALVGTMIHLLLNVSEVLKNIVKLTINFQTFFNINIAPFLETMLQNDKNKNISASDISQQGGNSKSVFLDSQITQDTTKIVKRRKDTDLQYEIKFQMVFLGDQDQHIPFIEDQKINLTISQQSTVLIYQVNQKARAKLVQALTKNFTPLLAKDQNQYGVLKIGGINIKDIPDQSMADYMGVIMSTNFYFTGTIRENITWKRGPLSEDEQQLALKIARQLTLDVDLKDFDQMLLDCRIQFVEGQINNEFSKKIAALRIFMKKPKIIIIKNTSSFIGEVSLVNLIRNEFFCSIIKITGSIQQIYDSARIVYMENLKILQEGKLSKFENNPSTKVGALLAESNIQGYLYQNQASFSPRKFKKRSTISDRDSSVHKSTRQDTDRSQWSGLRSELSLI